MMKPIIRLLRPDDLACIIPIIVQVSQESGIHELSYYHDDNDMPHLYHRFTQPGSAYWVVEDLDTHTILGGGGYERLAGTMPNEGIAELQKLYFSPQARGLGLGKRMVEHCLEQALNEGYRLMYLETAPTWATAIALYETLGFEHLPQRLGNTQYPPELSISMQLSLIPAWTCKQLLLNGQCA